MTEKILLVPITKSRRNSENFQKLQQLIPKLSNFKHQKLNIK